MTAYLLDTNIWLRSVQREAPQHSVAVEALATLLAQDNDLFITAQNLNRVLVSGKSPNRGQWSWLVSRNGPTRNRASSGAVPAAR